MVGLLSSTLNTELKSDPMRIINTQCKVVASVEEGGMGSGAQLYFLIYMFF